LLGRTSAWRGIIPGRNSVIVSLLLLLRRRISILGLFGAMMPFFGRYRARTHKKYAGIMDVERVLLLVLLLHYDGLECPISFARRHDMRFGIRDGVLLPTLFLVSRLCLTVGV
jgi:hypothetical protein